MGRTRIKICGVTRSEDALYAAELGVDAIGLVFYSKSPRLVNLDQGFKITQILPPFLTKVALFFNNDEREIETVLQTLPIDLIQFHGDESPEFCEQFNRAYIKAIPMLIEQELSIYSQLYKKAQGFLLDATQPGEPGGTGKSFDWSKIPRVFNKALILAGGLNPKNVADSIQHTACYAVDVSSGVESVKGIKDSKKMKEFVEQVRMADYATNS